MIVYDEDGLTLHQADVLGGLAALTDGSVQTCVTSPPYWGLRDYGVEGSLGLEPTPELYVERMVAVFREVRRVLRADGTLWLNLGDSYVASKTGDPTTGSTLQGGRSTQVAAWARPDKAVEGLRAKQLIGIPWLVAFALQRDGWYLRSDIIWAKPNPMPESVRDRPTKAHEYIFLLSKSQRYFFDQDAVREPNSENPVTVSRNGRADKGFVGASALYSTPQGQSGRGGVARPKSIYQQAKAKFDKAWKEAEAAKTGRNIRTVWTIATQPSPLPHFAAFPEELAERCIKAGSSEKGCCAACGAPRERVRERVSTGKSYAVGKSDDKRSKQGLATAFSGYDDGSSVPVFKTTGWAATCACETDSVPCVALDPFCGTGTTLKVARDLGRKAIGIELSPKYCDLAVTRLRYGTKGAVAVSNGQESLWGGQVEMIDEDKQSALGKRTYTGFNERWKNR